MYICLILSKKTKKTPPPQKKPNTPKTPNCFIRFQFQKLNHFEKSYKTR